MFFIGGQLPPLPEWKACPEVDNLKSVILVISAFTAIGHFGLLPPPFTDAHVEIKDKGQAKSTWYQKRVGALFFDDRNWNGLFVTLES